MTSKRQTNDTQNDNKQEYKNDKNIYINLFNKYKGQIREAKFYQRLKIIREIKNSSEYQELSIEEQKGLDKELLTSN